MRNMVECHLESGMVLIITALTIMGHSAAVLRLVAWVERTLERASGPGRTRGRFRKGACLARLRGEL